MFRASFRCPTSAPNPVFPQESKLLDIDYERRNLKTMMNFSELWKYFKLLGDPDQLSKEELAFLERFLVEQYPAERKKKNANT